MRAGSSLMILFSVSITIAAEPEASEKAAAVELGEIGGHVFLNLKTGRAKEVSLNRNAKVNNAHLKQVACFEWLTDLSLEQTKIGDDGIAAIAGLKKLDVPV